MCSLYRTRSLYRQVSDEGVEFLAGVIECFLYIEFVLYIGRVLYIGSFLMRAWNFLQIFF